MAAVEEVMGVSGIGEVEALGDVEKEGGRDPKVEEESVVGTGKAEGG